MKIYTKILILLISSFMFFSCSKEFNLSKSKDVLAYFSFEEELLNKELIDSSGNNFRAFSNTEKAVISEGKFGKALSFDGQNEFISFGNSVFEGDAFTICLWVKADEWKFWNRIFDFGKQNPDIYITCDGRTPGVLGLREERSTLQVYSFLPPSQQWFHVACVFGKGKMAMYLDGKLVEELEVPTSMEDFRSIENPGLYLGRSNWNDPYFKGLMDEVLIMQRALSSKEIKSVYNGIKK